MSWSFNLPLYYGVEKPKVTLVKKTKIENEKHTTYVKLRQKFWNNNTKIYIQLLHNMQCYFLFYAKITNDDDLIFNASKLPPCWCSLIEKTLQRYSPPPTAFWWRKIKSQRRPWTWLQERGHYRYKSKLLTEYTQRSITTNLNDPRWAALGTLCGPVRQYH